MKSKLNNSLLALPRKTRALGRMVLAAAAAAAGSTFLGREGLVAHQLRHYRLSTTVLNQLWCYCAGIDSEHACIFPKGEKRWLVCSRRPQRGAGPSKMGTEVNGNTGMMIHSFLYSLLSEGGGGICYVFHTRCVPLACHRGGYEVVADITRFRRGLWM
jgi:hypothetical protein